jgi:hypothetical protein
VHLPPTSAAALLTLLAAAGLFALALAAASHDVAPDPVSASEMPATVAHEHRELRTTPGREPGIGVAYVVAGPDLSYSTRCSAVPRDCSPSSRPCRPAGIRSSVRVQVHRRDRASRTLSVRSRGRHAQGVRPRP